MLVCCDRVVSFSEDDYAKSTATDTSPVASNSYYYMHPSQFFTRYFSCRYQLRLQHLPSRTAGEWELSDDQKSLDQKPFRHARRQLFKVLVCPPDCDGVVRWEETPINTAQRISCLDVVQSVEEKVPDWGIHESSFWSEEHGEQVDSPTASSNQVNRVMLRRHMIAGKFLP